MKKRNSGFTLIEILTVIAVIGILMAVAAPGLIAWREKARFTGSLQALTADLQRCKISAIQDNGTCQVELTATNYNICLVRDGNNTCDATVDMMIGSKPWEPGYTIRYGQSVETPPPMINPVVTLPSGFDFNGRGLADFSDDPVLLGKPEVIIEMNGNGGHQGFVRINMLGRIGQTYE